MSVRVASVLLLLASVLPAQVVIPVMGGGAALQQAVLAASPGDILDVHPGNYSSVTVTRGLRLLLQPGVQIVGGPYTVSLTISAIPAGETLVVAGGRLQGISALGCAGTVVWDGIYILENFFDVSWIDGCTGPVACQGVQGGASYFAQSRIQVRDCSQVSFHGGTLPSVRVTNSTVTFHGVVIPKHNTASGLAIDSGSVSIAGGSMAGGNFFSLPVELPGISMTQGTLVLTDGALIIAETYWHAFYPSSPGVSAIEAGSGTVVLDPSVSFVTWPGTSGVSGGANVTNRSVPSLAMLRQPGAFHLALRAEPGSVLFTAWNLPLPAIHLPFGELWLDPASPVLAVTAMPASGRAVVSGSLPVAPPFQVLVAQSLAWTAAGELLLGVPDRVVWD
ncbi:MAG TPA: hypothetical protein VFZ65_15955 [Planctomycetota bacterium]|nr:hypothetical protein [Planctomycetota bacterium]